MSAPTREALVAEYRAALAAWRASPDPGDRTCRRMDDAWDELAEWKHERDECLHVDCSATVPGYSYCETHR